MFTYIYIPSYRVTHTYTHTYTDIYFKPHNASTQPSQPQQPAAAAAAAAAAGCCYTFEEMEEMQASANVPIRDIYIYKSMYIYIYIGLSFKWDIQDWWEI